MNADFGTSQFQRIALIAVGLVLFVATIWADDWPQFHGLNRDGISKETGLLNKWPEKGPPLVWEKQVGEGFSGPVVSENKLIVFHRVGNKEIVECLQADTGKRLWKTERDTEYQDNLNKGDGPRSTPVIAGDRVFTLGADGYLQCLQFRDGKSLWGRDLHKNYNVPQNFFGVGTSPLVEGSLVLVNVGGPQAGIVAFAADTGKEVWKATNHEASYSSPVVATIAEKRVAVFLTREGVVLLDPSNGRILHEQTWRARYDASVNAATPLVIGKQLFFSASYETGALLLEFDGSRAKTIWSGDELMSNHYNTCVYHDGHLYGIHGRQEAGAGMRCVEFANGKVKWSQPRFGCASLILADGKILALTEGGELVLFQPSPERYQEISRAKVLNDTPSRSPPALADGKLFVRDQSKLICLDLRANR